MADRPTSGERVPGAYEPLYRAGEPVPPESTDPGWGRHSAPDREPSVGDQFGWLYRSEEPAPAHAEPASEVQDDTAPRMPVVPSPPLLPGLEPIDERPPGESPQRRRRGLVLLVGLLVAGLIVAGIVITRWWTAPRTQADPPATRSSGPTGAAPSDSGAPSVSGSGSYQGEVAAVTPSAASADCTAADAKDDAGATVTYTAANTFDGDTATAWRCDGSGADATIVFTLPAGTSVAELGLINGYAKTDPKSNKDRYDEYRRITAVTWKVGDQQISQQLSDGQEGLQTLRIAPLDSDTVTLTIDQASAPGSTAKTRDAVLISEIRIGAPA